MANKKGFSKKFIKKAIEKLGDLRKLLAKKKDGKDPLKNLKPPQRSTALRNN